MEKTPTCPACHKELTEEDTLDWRVLSPEYNRFTIGEWHYATAGAALTAWIIGIFFTVLVLLGRIQFLP